MKKAIHRDVYVGIALVIFCAAVFNLSLAIPKGANYLPLALSIFMGAMSVIIILNGVRQTKQTQAGQAHQYSTEFKDMIKPLIVYGLVVLYYIGFQVLGYFAATPLFLIAVQQYLKAGSIKKILLVTAGYMVFTYILFVSVLALPIYRVGILGGLFRF